MAEFTPFPVPVHPKDTQLVYVNGPDYVCSGCDLPVPDGVALYPVIEQGKVTGLLASRGGNSPPAHACGSAAQD